MSYMIKQTHKHTDQEILLKGFSSIKSAKTHQNYMNYDPDARDWDYEILEETEEE